MKKVIERVQRLQALFGDFAENIAQQTGFIRRKRKITAIGWLLAVVFGWTENKNGTIETLVEQFQLQDVELTEPWLKSIAHDKASANSFRLVRKIAWTFGRCSARSLRTG